MPVAGGAQEIEGRGRAIELVLPADVRLLRIARLAASGVASLGGFDVAEIEDVRIAVDELCSAAIGAAPMQPVHLAFHVDERSLLVEAMIEAPDGVDDAVRSNGLMDSILDVVADSHGWQRSGSHLTGHVHKRSASPRLSAVP